MTNSHFHHSFSSPEAVPQTVQKQIEGAMKELVQAEAEMLMLKQFITEPGTDPLAWADGVEERIGNALNHLRSIVAVRLSVLPSVTDEEEKTQDHGAELAADVNDTGSSPTESASLIDSWRRTGEISGNPAYGICAAELEALVLVPLFEYRRTTEALNLCLAALQRHDGWCGYKKDSPGDSIYRRAEAAASAALWPDPLAGKQATTGVSSATAASSAQKEHSQVLSILQPKEQKDQEPVRAPASLSPAVEPLTLAATTEAD